MPDFGGPGSGGRKPPSEGEIRAPDGEKPPDSLKVGRKSAKSGDLSTSWGLEFHGETSSTHLADPIFGAQRAKFALGGRNRGSGGRNRGSGGRFSPRSAQIGGFSPLPRANRRSDERGPGAPRPGFPRSEGSEPPTRQFGGPKGIYARSLEKTCPEGLKKKIYFLELRNDVSGWPIWTLGVTLSDDLDGVRPG